MSLESYVVIGCTPSGLEPLRCVCVFVGWFARATLPLSLDPHWAMKGLMPGQQSEGQPSRLVPKLRGYPGKDNMTAVWRRPRPTSMTHKADRRIIDHLIGPHNPIDDGR